MKFLKYTAGGNDFLIFHDENLENSQDIRSGNFDLPKIAKSICNRNFGVGSDGLIYLFKSQNSKNNGASYEWQFYNSDGSGARMCGNASLCVASYAFINNFAKKSHRFYNGSNCIDVEILDTQKKMPSQNLFSQKMLVKTRLTNNGSVEKVTLENGGIGYLTDTGVPHLCIFRKNLPSQKLNYISKLRHEFNANVNFISVKDNSLFVNTFERGVEDFTLSCGTGMAASFIVARKLEIISDCEIDIFARSGSKYNFSFQNDAIYFSGISELIARIEIFI